MFWAAIFDNYCYIENQLPHICLITDFGAKLKILKFGAKNASNHKKTIIIIEINALEFVLLQSLVQK